MKIKSRKFVSAIIIGAFSLVNVAYCGAAECGDNASYNAGTSMCECNEGFSMSDDGKTCVKLEAPETSAEVSEAAPEAAKVTVTKSNPEKGEYTIQEGSVIKLELVESLSSQMNRVGDIVHFKVVDDVKLDGVIIIEKGAEGLGQVVTAKAAKGWGKSGKLEIEIKTVVAVDGTIIPLVASMGEGKSWAAGKTIIGTATLGLLFGGGMKGKKVYIDKGLQLEVFVQKNTVVVPGQTNASASEDEGDVSCFSACENKEGDKFKVCMEKCTECVEVCKGETGDEFSMCMYKCGELKVEYKD